MSDSQTTNSFVSRPYLDPEIVRLRLDTEELLKKVEIFLKGEKEEYIQDPKTGKTRVIISKISMAKASPEGIQAIYSQISMFINAHMAQGNFPIDKEGYSKKYEQLNRWIHDDLNTHLANNIYEYWINDNDYQSIIKFCTNAIRIFLTRAINNEERKGLSNVETKESQLTERDKKASLWG